jgi:hypothetical protein
MRWWQAEGRRTFTGEMAKSQARFIRSDEGAKPSAASGSSIGLTTAWEDAWAEYGSGYTMIDPEPGQLGHVHLTLRGDRQPELNEDGRRSHLDRLYERLIHPWWVWDLLLRAKRTGGPDRR